MEYRKTEYKNKEDLINKIDFIIQSEVNVNASAWYHLAKKVIIDNFENDISIEKLKEKVENTKNKILMMVLERLLVLFLMKLKKHEKLILI